MFKKPFSFEGRIRRLEYGLSYIIYFIFLMVFFAIIDLLKLDDATSTFSDILTFIIFVPCIWFLLAQGCKRCHDRGNLGIYQIIPFYFFWMLFAESDYGPNEYGPNPNGIGNYDEINEIGKDISD